MYPAVRDIKKEYSERIVFIVANFKEDETLVLASLYNIRYVPAFIVTDALGLVAASDGGVLSRDALRNLIEQGLTP